MRTLFVGSVLLLAACSSGAQLTDLRCRKEGCQPRENPWRLQLEVAYEDPGSALADGTMSVRVDSNTQAPIALKSLVKGTSGTIPIDVDVPLRELKDGSILVVGVSAKDGSDQQTGEITLNFTMKL